MARLGVLFPGQGAQHPGMGKLLWERFGCARDVFAEASETLNRDIGQLCFDGTEEVLRETDTAQPALYTVGYAGWRALSELLGNELVLVVGAGHSLGEYTALAAAGAVSFADGLRLVAERGRLMRRAGDEIPGMMVAVVGLGLEQVEEACAAARSRGPSTEVVVVANDNAPGQVVISGTPNGITVASAAARDLGARRVIPLATSGAFHSPLMEPAAGELSRAIDVAPLGRAICPIIANTTAMPIQEPAEIRAELTAQLCARVRWVETVRRMQQYQVDAMIELGPGQVLTGLVRRIESGMKVLSIGDGDGFDAVVASL